jgi:hypothetical protein
MKLGKYQKNKSFFLVSENYLHLKIKILRCDMVAIGDRLVFRCYG